LNLLKSELASMAPGLITGSCLLLALLVWYGLASRRWYVREGRNSLYHRSRYVRLPLLLAGMAVSHVLFVASAWRPWTYFVIGVVWGVTYPVRALVGYYIMRRKLNTRLLWDGTWGVAALSAVMHGILWPITVPACFAAANELGFVHSPYDEKDAT
jgi:hypothetical protein